MKRFRFTLLAVCLVLLWLGGTRLNQSLQNRTPATVSLTELQEHGAPREYLRITGGCLDLERAISTSGSIELKALLVPLTPSPESGQFRVLVETRDPVLLRLFSDYHFKPDTEFEQREFLENHRAEFHPCRDVTGMLPTALITSSNRSKAEEVLQGAGIEAPEDILFFTEGKEPDGIWGGAFLLIIGLLGLVRVALRWKQGKAAPSGESDLILPPRE